MAETLISIVDSDGSVRSKNRRNDGEIFTRYLFTDGAYHYNLTIDENDEPHDMYEKINDVYTYLVAWIDRWSGLYTVVLIDLISNIQYRVIIEEHVNQIFIGNPSDDLKEKMIRFNNLANSRAQEAIRMPTVKLALRQLPLPIINEIWHHYRTI